MSGFTYLDFILEPEAQKLLTAVAVGGAMIAGGYKAAKAIETPEGRKEHIIPSKKISFFGVVDFAAERFIQFQDQVMGKEHRSHAPFIVSLFFFIFFMNLLGVFPGMPAATTSIWVNLGMAISVFLYFNYQGIREQGFWHYVAHFAGPVWWLALFMFPLEIFSLCLRVFTLNLRLYWNISGDHTVMGIMHDLLGWFAVPFASPIFLLAFFVSFMQAFVFTVLTMVYIVLAVQHDESHDEEHA